MNYLREGDTPDHHSTGWLARSVVHLAQLAKRFQSEKIDILVVDQNIDTSTSTGRLMFNMLAAIAEFEMTCAPSARLKDCQSKGKWCEVWSTAC